MYLLLGRPGSVKRISKSAKDADKEILKLHTEERKEAFFTDCLCRRWRHVGKCDKELSLV